MRVKHKESKDYVANLTNRFADTFHDNRIKNSDFCSLENDDVPLCSEVVDVDFGSMTMAEDDKESKPVPAAAQEVQDDDLGDVGAQDELYQNKIKEKVEDNKVLDAVTSNMSEIKSTMNNVMLKQVDVLNKNADQMQTMQASQMEMQHNVTTVVESQAKLVSSISTAIDKKFEQSNAMMIDTVIDKVDSNVSDRVNTSLDRHNNERRKKKRKERIWGIVKIVLVAFVCLLLYLNDTTRLRIGLVATDVKDLVVGIANGEEVSSNKLVEDLGIHLHNANTTYHDEDGNVITEEEYYKKLYTTEHKDSKTISYEENKEE